jgi:hypothetical protein
MSRAAKTILAFGLYLASLGAALAIAPDAMLALFGQGPSHEPWLRLLGLVSLVLGSYYIGAARAELTPFFRMTLYGRAAGCVGFAATVGAGWAPRFVLLIAALDGAGALWTFRELRRPAVSRRRPLSAGG